MDSRLLRRAGARPAQLLLKLALAAVCAAAALGAAARTPEEAYQQALDAEVLHGDLPHALELYHEAAKANAAELRTNATIATARVHLRQEDTRGFNQALGTLPPAKSLTVGQVAEVARLKHARDEQLRDPRRPVTASPAPPRATRDVALADVSLEDAALALSNQYGVTLVAPDPAPQRVHLHLKQVTFHQALLALVFHTGLDARRSGRMYYLGTPRRLATWFPADASSAAELFSADAVSKIIAPATSVTLALANQPVAEAVRRMVDGFGVNVVSAATASKVTLDLSRVGLDGALRSIASQLGWEIRRVNDMYFLGPGTHLAVYFPGFERRYLRLRHVSAGEIYDQVQEFLGKEHLRLARIEVDIVGNALIIEGDKVDLDKVERFLAQEDVTQQSVGLELWIKDYRVPQPAELPHKRIRMLAGQMGIVTLDADVRSEPAAISTTATTATAGTTAPVAVASPSAAPSPLSTGQIQLMVELTPRLKAANQVAFDLSWRLTTLRPGHPADVQEGATKRVQTNLDTALEVPVLSGPGGTARLALMLKPGD